MWPFMPATHMQTWTSLPAWRPKSLQSYAQAIYPFFPTVISQPDRKCIYWIQVKTESPLSCIQSPFLPPNHLNAYIRWGLMLIILWTVIINLFVYWMEKNKYFYFFKKRELHELPYTKIVKFGTFLLALALYLWATNGLILLIFLTIFKDKKKRKGAYF